MNKRQYQRLLALRKSEENLFYYVCRKSWEEYQMTPREIIDIFPINYKRAWYLLEKWSEQGIYNYGVSLDLGWFEDKKGRI